MFRDTNLIVPKGYKHDVFLLNLYKNYFLGYFIKRGRKLWATNFVLKVFYELKKSEKIDPTFIFFAAFLKLSPKVLLQPMKFGGQTKMIPIPITLKKQTVFVLNWVILSIRAQKRRITVGEVSDLLLLALEDKGYSWKKLQQQHATAVENRYLLKKYFK
jgi:ribosomal protein S7